MAINTWLVNSQSSKLQDCSSKFANIGRGMTNVKENIGCHWQADEMSYVNFAIEEIINDISKLRDELEELNIDIRAVANEIVAEE